jgi:uncharacterized membrane protein
VLNRKYQDIEPPQPSIFTNFSPIPLYSFSLDTSKPYTLYRPPATVAVTSLAINSPTSTAKATLLASNRGLYNSILSIIVYIARRRVVSTVKPVRAPTWLYYLVVTTIATLIKAIRYSIVVLIVKTTKNIRRILNLITFVIGF